MLVIKKQSNSLKVAVSAKLKIENKAFIALTQEAINDLIPESNAASSINFTESLEFLLEQFSQRNPYILQINDKNYTVSEVIEKYLKKYITDQIPAFLSTPTKVMNQLDGIFADLLEQKIAALNSDAKADKDSFKSRKSNNADQDELEYLYDEYPLASFNIQYHDLNSIDDLSNAYNYLYTAYDKHAREDFYDLQLEFENAVFKLLKIDNALLCYKPYDDSNTLEDNIALIRKLIKLYLHKQEHLNSFEGYTDTPCYKGELEKFLSGSYDV